MNTKKHGRLTSKMKKAISVAVMGSVCLTAAVSVAALSKTVTVTDGDKTVTINTINPDTNLILERTGVSLGDNDKLVRTDEDEDTINISILRAFNVEVVDGNTTKVLTFNEGTVADAIKAAGLTLSENDSVSFSANTELEPDMEIKIARWYTVKVDLRGEKIEKEVPAGTVEDALKYLDITLEKDDVINVDTKEEVKDGFEIEIKSVTYKESTKKEAVDFKTVEKDTDTLYIGESEVETEGVKGERTIVTKETYINGKLDSTEEISNEVTKEPVDKVVLNGTVEKVHKIFETYTGSITVNEAEGILTDTNGNQVRYTQVLNGSGTAYTSDPGALCSTGRVARYGCVAVDPDIIPYGSILYIAASDGSVVYGYAVAGDTGGALWEHTALVDLYYYTYDECINFGRRNVNVYVLDGVSEDATY